MAAQRGKQTRTPWLGTDLGQSRKSGTPESRRSDRPAIRYRLRYLQSGSAGWTPGRVTPEGTREGAQMLSNTPVSSDLMIRCEMQRR